MLSKYLNITKAELETSVKQNERRWSKTFRTERQNQMGWEMAAGWVSIVTLHWFWDKTSSFASAEADLHRFFTIHNHLLNFLLYQTIFSARRIGRAQRSLQLHQNLAFVVSSFLLTFHFSKIFHQIVFIQLDISNFSTSNPFTSLSITAHVEKLPAKNWSCA